MKDDNKIKPSKLKSDVGEKASFKCDSEVDVQWYFKSTQGEPIEWGTNLIFQELKSRQSGYYYCYGKYPKKKHYFLAKAELKVYGNYVITEIKLYDCSGNFR